MMNTTASSPRRIRPRTTSSACCRPAPSSSSPFEDGRVHGSSDRGNVSGNGGRGRGTTAARRTAAAAMGLIAVLLSPSSSSSSSPSSPWSNNPPPVAVASMIACAFAPPRPPTTASARRTGRAAVPIAPRRLLTREEEASLLGRMRDHPPHTPASQSARQELLLHNLPLVRSIASEVQRSRRSSSPPSSSESASLTRDDLLHEGTIGLAEAIDRHDPGLDARLSTYASYWIRARIVRAVLSRGEHALLRFPERVVQASHRLARAARGMGLEWDDVVDLSVLVGDGGGGGGGDDLGLGLGLGLAGERTRELRARLCERAGIPTSGTLFGDAVRVRSMSMSGTTTAPLESWMGPSWAGTAGDDEDDHGAVPAGPTSPSSSFEGGATEGGGQERIVETLSKFLVPREVEVLSLRYGLVPSSSSSSSSTAPVKEEDAVGMADSSSAVAAASSPRTTTTTTPTTSTRGRPGRRPAFRDYEAEAEEGLFGPRGMLPHYGTAPNNGDGAVATTDASAAPSKLNNRNDRVFPSTTTPPTAAAAAMAAPSERTPASPGAEETTGMATSSSSSSPSPPPPSATNSLLPFKEIGKRMKYSGEYCRRTCTVALSKLSRAAEEGRLTESDFLLGW
jgi:RNA polymerase sigma factor (sigma-70 family)